MTVYEVDLNRLVIKLTQKNGGSYVYTYDPVHRLTGITTPLGLTFLIDSGGYDRAAFELGRIVGNAAAIAAIFGMFFAGGGAISGAFMGGAMALTLGAAGAATVEIAAGATVVAAKGNSIAEALNSLMSEMSGASNFGGKGTEEEGESETDTNLSAGKNFKDHYIRHKGLLEKKLDKKYPKYKESNNGQEFLQDLQNLIDDGFLEYQGLGTLKKGAEPMNIYRGDGLTLVVKTNGEFVTLLESGTGLDLGIQLLK